MIRPTVVLSALLVSSSAWAQAPTHAWINVDAIRAVSAQQARTSSFSTTIFLETASAAAAYPAIPAVNGVLVGGGVGHGPIGFGVQVTTSSALMTVGLAIAIPHPTVFNRLATDADVTSGTLDRHETAVDLSAVYTAPTPSRVRVQIAGGPTHFSVRQVMVQQIHYDQTFTLGGLNSVNITTYDTQEQSDSAWGFHVAGDVAYFFSRYVGVGGGVRVNRGTAHVVDPLNTTETALRVGHTIAGAGLRLRF